MKNLSSDAVTLARLRSRSCIIDGEAVACDGKGVASFDLIRHHGHNDHVFLYAFDLIELNGEDLRHDPLEGRKATLEMILTKDGPAFDSMSISRATVRLSSATLQARPGRHCVET